MTSEGCTSKPKECHRMICRIVLWNNYPDRNEVTKKARVPVSLSICCRRATCTSERICSLAFLRSKHVMFENILMVMGQLGRLIPRLSEPNFVSAETKLVLACRKPKTALPEEPSSRRRFAHEGVLRAACELAYQLDRLPYKGRPGQEHDEKSNGEISRRVH
jgi:hypothetical protein